MTKMTKLSVRDLMTDTIFALRAGDDIQMARDLMDERNVRHVPVVDEDRHLVGLVSERDLLRNMYPSTSELPVGTQQAVLKRVKVDAIMTRDVETVEPEDDLVVAAQIILDNKFGCVPVVVEGGRVEGILTESDFVRYLADQG